ncbi:MAG: preprotein translocase subunit YajC [Acidobacteria bacterium]|nr:preprotein translocase subunit YajC [Acidobacteriota bacterium]
MTPAQGQSPIASLIPVVAMVLIFYFLLIAPVRKRQKQHDAMIANLKNGDRVVTNGGIIGTIAGIQEDRIRVKVADQVKIEITKQSVASLADADSDS